MNLKDSFYANILKMFVGTTGAYVFWGLSMLVVGRLYTPEYFGGGQLFISAASILSVVATGRYEKALMLPRFHFQALRVFLFSVLLSLLCTVVSFLMIVCFKNPLATFIGITTESIVLLPIYMLELCLYVLFYAWMVRTKKYAAAAIGLVLFPLSYLIFCIGFCTLSIPVHKLILAIILARGLEILYYGRYLYGDMKCCLKHVSWQGILRQGKEYADFPKYVLAGSFVESAAVHMVPFLVSAFWGLEATGYYAMAMQVLAAPAGLIAKAVRDVFMQEGARLYGKYRECRGFYRKNLSLCLIYSAVVCIGAYVVVPLLLPMVLGEKWNVAGQYVRLMLPMTFGMLVSVPLLDMYSIARRQKQYLLIQTAFLASSMVGIGIAGNLGYSVGTAMTSWGLLVLLVSSVSVYGGWIIARGWERT